MLENTWYSVISPESCSSILWRSWDFKEQAAEALKLTAKDMTGFGLVDGIIKEPLGGAHTNMKWQVNQIKETILKNIKELQSLPVEKMVENRINKICAMGVVDA